MKKIKIGIVGCGVIGKGAALFIEKSLKRKAVVSALADKNEGRARALKRMLRAAPRILEVGQLVKEVSLIIEAASQECAEDILRKATGFSAKSGFTAREKSVIILSVGALIKNVPLLKKAESRGVTIYIPSGAICGVDALGALGLGTIKKISLITSKPPAGLKGVAYLEKKGVRVEKIKREMVLFRGAVAKAIKCFPKNINVAATLLLASGGRKNFKVYIKVNPRLKRNLHRIEIEAKEARVSTEIENVPSRNPKTSTLAVLSAQALLKKIFASFKVGS